MNGEVGGTIVERLQSQRTLLVDVVHQIEAAIKTFGGAITPNGNGNGTTETKVDGRGKFWAGATAAQRKRILAKRAATRRANRQARTDAPVTTTGGF